MGINGGEGEAMKLFQATAAESCMRACLGTSTRLYTLCIMLMHLLCLVQKPGGLTAAFCGEVIAWKEQDGHLRYSIPMSRSEHFSRSRNGNIRTDSWEKHVKSIHQLSLLCINTHVGQSQEALSYYSGLTDENGSVVTLFEQKVRRSIFRPISPNKNKSGEY